MNLFTNDTCKETCVYTYMTSDTEHPVSEVILMRGIIDRSKKFLEIIPRKPRNCSNDCIHKQRQRPLPYDNLL